MLVLILPDFGFLFCFIISHPENQKLSVCNCVIKMIMVVKVTLMSSVSCKFGCAVTDDEGHYLSNYWRITNSTYI